MEKKSAEHELPRANKARQQAKKTPIITFARVFDGRGRCEGVRGVRSAAERGGPLHVGSK